MTVQRAVNPNNDASTVSINFYWTDSRGIPRTDDRRKERRTNKIEILYRREKYLELTRKADELSRSIHILDDKFTFCFHLHGDIPHVSVWRYGEATTALWVFNLYPKPELIEYTGLPMDSLDISESKAILVNWLVSDYER